MRGYSKGGRYDGLKTAFAYVAKLISETRLKAQNADLFLAREGSLVVVCAAGPAAIASEVKISGNRQAKLISRIEDNIRRIENGWLVRYATKYGLKPTVS